MKTKLTSMLIVTLCAICNAFAQKPAATLLTPTNHTLVMIDHQSQMAFAVKNISIEQLRDNVALVAGGSKIFKVPTVVTTVAEKTFSGPVFPEILSVYPPASSGYVDRSTMNPWEDAGAHKAITAKGRKKLVMTGLWTGVCVALPVLSAIQEGYEVYVITDASGDLTLEAHEMAIQRMIKAGAIPMTSAQYVLELQRDWGRADTYDAVTRLFHDFGGAYGIGLQYAKAALKH